MKSVNSGMTKRVLTEILASEYGVESPSNANKDTILGLLKDNGCVVTPEAVDEVVEEVEESQPAKPKRYIINIFKEKNERGAVTGGINGKAFALPRGKDIEVSEEIYYNLTKGAIREIGQQVDGGGIEFYSQQAYPLTLVKVID